MAEANPNGNANSVGDGVPIYRKGKSWDLFHKEIEAWCYTTSVKTEKRALRIAVKLPEGPENRLLKERLFTELSVNELKGADGMVRLIEFLEKNLKVEDLEDSVDKWETVENTFRRDDQSMAEFIDDFDYKYQCVESKGTKLAPDILAFMMLKRANITHDEKLLVLTGMDFDSKETLFSDAKKALKKYKPIKKEEPKSVKEEDSRNGAEKFTTQDDNFENVHFVSQPQRQYGYNYYSRGNRGGGYRGGGSRGGRRNQRGYYNFNNNGTGRGSGNNNGQINPSRNGIPITCDHCGSYRHLIRFCPDMNQQHARVNVAETAESQPGKSQPDVELEGEGHVILYTGYSENNLRTFTIEALNCAVLDSGCSSTVCGRPWLEAYLENLDDNCVDRVKIKSSQKKFKFGSGNILQSQGQYTIPVRLVGTDVLIRCDVVNADLPLLLSKNAMKQAKIILDMENDTAKILGKTISLNLTSSGHYCVNLLDDENINRVNLVSLQALNGEELKKCLLKLHRQFGHPSRKKLTGLLKDANVWNETFDIVLDNIYSHCELCQVYAPTPPRSAVALPMASKFNQRVCMDLKQWQGKYILHLIDMFTRYSVSIFITDKHPSTVINAILTSWVAYFGNFKSAFSDNGGEFNSGEMREISSQLGVELLTTAGASPWQNGLCEKNHQIVDMILTKLNAEYPKTSTHVLLKWANMAKNSLQMHNGYSSHQLVYGQNPNLPNIVQSDLPAWQEYSTSDILVRHLNALHSARKAFIESESSERIRRAMRNKIKVSEVLYNPGDLVFYKRESSDRWLGPAKVIFQDRKIVFIRHGGVYVRVSTNRLVKKHRESSDQVQIDKTDASDSKVSLSENIEPKKIEASSSNPDSGVNNDENHSDVLDSTNTNTATSENSRNLRKIPRRDYARLNSEGSVLINCINDSVISSDSKNDSVLISNSIKDSPEIHLAKMTELEKLKHFSTYEEVEDVGQYKISTRWVITENKGNVKARLVARGYEEMSNIQSDSPTVAKTVMRILLSVAASKNWSLAATDITAAFLQGREIERDIFIQPPIEIRIKGIIWRLKRCLYGLNDAAREFYLSVSEQMMKLACNQSTLDHSLYYKHSPNGDLQGIMISHIDDFLHGGISSFQNSVMKPLRQRFIAGKLVEGEFKYVGFQIAQNNEGIVLNQFDYIESISIPVISHGRLAQKRSVLNVNEQTLFRSLVGSLNWIVQGSRPDLAFDLIDLSTKLNSATIDDFCRAIKVLKRAKDCQSAVKFSNLGDYKNWEILVYTDAAHANLSDGVSSTSAMVVFIRSGEKCVPLSWRCCKIKRVVRSTLAAEALALQEGLEEAIYLQTLLLELTKHKIPIIAKVDSNGLCEAIKSTKSVNDRRLRIDIAAIKQEVGGDVKDVIWCPGCENLANCMTKRGASASSLLAVFNSGIVPI